MKTKQNKNRFTRRDFLTAAATGGAAAFGILSGRKLYQKYTFRADSFIAKAASYGVDFSAIIQSGFREIGVEASEIHGKTILLKPNLVETRQGMPHINTHPLVVQGAADAFLNLGARRIIIAEGPGHCRDTRRLVTESGLDLVLKERKIRFVDINFDDVFFVLNHNGISGLKELALPKVLKQADWVVSVAKMKTHHWAGVTLSMKNMFGIMPGSFYGWPKNVLHYAGIGQSILDINAVVKPHFAIVDGITGMQGDGPIMGDPVQSGVLVMGRNFPAVDATCARIMGIDPYKVPYLDAADLRLGTLDPWFIKQRGETIQSCRHPFALLDHIPAQKGIRL